MCGGDDSPVDTERKGLMERGQVGRPAGDRQHAIGVHDHVIHVSGGDRRPHAHFAGQRRAPVTKPVESRAQQSFNHGDGPAPIFPIVRSDT